MGDKMRYIDSHIHLDHRRYEGLGREILRECVETSRIDRVVIPAIEWDSNRGMRDMFPDSEFGKYVFFAAGIHPKRINSDSTWTKEKKQQFEMWLADERTVAVKTGLDFSNTHLQDNQKEHQKEFMRMMIDYAAGRIANTERGLPVVFHVRDAAEEAVEVLRDHPAGTGAEIHCFTFDYDTACKFMDAGVECEYHVFPGCYHCFELSVPDADFSVKAYERTYEALKRAFYEKE